MAMIEIKNVTYSYRVTDAEGHSVSRTAVEDLSLAIEKGELIVLTGSSGCGKTTVCRLLNGLIPHYFQGDLIGEVLIDGESVAAAPIDKTAHTVGSVFQNPRSQFFNVDTTSELAFAAENQSRDPEQIRRDIATVAQQMGLEPLLGRSMFCLSGGEKQRIACGTVAVADTAVIVLDEPSSNLDRDGMEELRKTLALWKSQGKTVIIAEHRLFFLRELADRVLLFADGRVTRTLSGQEFAALSAEETAAMGLRTVNWNTLRFTESRAENTEQFTIKKMNFIYSDKAHGIAIPSLALPKRHIIAIVGHNGAGKSTFARTLCGLNKKAKGKVICGKRRVRVSKMLRHCYMIMQDVNHQLFTESVWEEVLLSISDRLPQEQREEKVREAMWLLDIEALADFHPMALSGGQKQRVAIACAVASDKELILFDEPTSGLDYEHMKQVAAILQLLRARGKTVFVITHDPELIALCADDILLIENGGAAEHYPITAENSKRICEFFLK